MEAELEQPRAKRPGNDVVVGRGRRAPGLEVELGPRGWGYHRGGGVGGLPAADSQSKPSLCTDGRGAERGRSHGPQRHRVEPRPGGPAPGVRTPPEGASLLGSPSSQTSTPTPRTATLRHRGCAWQRRQAERRLQEEKAVGGPLEPRFWFQAQRPRRNAGLERGTGLCVGSNPPTPHTRPSLCTAASWGPPPTEGTRLVELGGRLCSSSRPLPAPALWRHLLRVPCAPPAAFWQGGSAQLLSLGQGEAWDADGRWVGARVSEAVWMDRWMAGAGVQALSRKSTEARLEVTSQTRFRMRPPTWNAASRWGCAQVGLCGGHKSV